MVIIVVIVASSNLLGVKFISSLQRNPFLQLVNDIFCLFIEQFGSQSKLKYLFIISS
jgi:hypothetical protein